MDDYKQLCYYLNNILELSSRSEPRQHVSCSGLVGTPLYMSPEQLEHTRCTEKVDIYALGIIYFEMNYVFQTPRDRIKVILLIT